MRQWLRFWGYTFISYQTKTYYQRAWEVVAVGVAGVGELVAVVVVAVVVVVVVVVVVLLG